MSSNRQQSVSISLRCEDCIHFKGVRHQNFSAPCSELGTKAYATSCAVFNPLVSNLARATGALPALADVLDQMTESDMRLFIYAAQKTQQIKKASGGKFRFGQKVFINLSAPYVEYIDVYFQAVVLSVLPADEGSDTGYIVLGGSLQDEIGASITVPIQNALTEAEWEVKLRSLFFAGKTNAPQCNKLRRVLPPVISKASYEAYQAPTIFSSEAEVKNLGAKRKKIKVQILEDNDQEMEVSGSSKSDKSSVITFDRDQ